MKTVTCDRCGKVIKGGYRELTTNVVTNIPDAHGMVISDCVYRVPRHYQLCAKCSREFDYAYDDFVAKFIHPNKNNTCETCKFFGNNDGLFPCGGCETLCTADGTIIHSQWMSKDGGDEDE